MAYDLFSEDYEVWDNRPGGTIVEIVINRGTTYYLVEFDHSPGKRYKFLAPDA